MPKKKSGLFKSTLASTYLTMRKFTTFSLSLQGLFKEDPVDFAFFLKKQALQAACNAYFMHFSAPTQMLEKAGQQKGRQIHQHHRSAHRRTDEVRAGQADAEAQHA